MPISVNKALRNCVRNRRWSLCREEGSTTAGRLWGMARIGSSSSSSSQSGRDEHSPSEGHREERLGQRHVVGPGFKAIRPTDPGDGDSRLLRRLHGTRCPESRGSFPGWSSVSSCKSLDYAGDHDRRVIVQWKSGAILRMLSTKPIAEAEGGRKAPDANEASPGQDPVDRPKTIDDFKHEEIEGPTVERDMSDTANQLRSSQGDLTTVMASLQSGFVALGCVQLVATIWATVSHDMGFIQGLSQDLAFIVSFFLAYLLRYYVSAVEFFRRVEERGRMRIITLSLQVTKMLTKFFKRSDFMVKGVAAASLGVLLIDIWRSQFGK